MKKVAIIMGSDSDLPIVEKCTKMLDELGVPYEAHVFSAHRSPDETMNFARKAEEKGFGVLIGVAGMAAHLAGSLAANTCLPVIGIPCKSAALEGLDALLSTVMMPSGIPVATVAIDGGKNAAILAAQIISLTDDALMARLKAQREDGHKANLEKNRKVEEKLNK